MLEAAELLVVVAEDEETCVEETVELLATEELLTEELLEETVADELTCELATELASELAAALLLDGLLDRAGGLSLPPPELPHPAKYVANIKGNVRLSIFMVSSCSQFLK